MEQSIEVSNGRSKFAQAFAPVAASGLAGSLHVYVPSHEAHTT
jgi:hypothetical protein